jgi:hypothetical protein
MSYSEFTLSQLEHDFHVTIDERLSIFANVQSVVISSFLAELLAENVPLALAIHTEKARSEMIIAPILIELRKIVKHKISLFSGTDLSVDIEQGLNGVCDFIISKSPEQLFVKFPILIIVEAKNENIKAGLPQCLAAMIAAQLFNKRANKTARTIYGAVTTGNVWRFLQLQGSTAGIDIDEYYISAPGKLLGILLYMIDNET